MRLKRKSTNHQFINLFCSLIVKLIKNSILSPSHEISHQQYRYITPSVAKFFVNKLNETIYFFLDQLIIKVNANYCKFFT